MVEIDVFGNVIKKPEPKQPLKEVVAPQKKPILEEVVVPEEPVVVEEVKEEEPAPKKKGSRKKKTVEE